MDARLFNFSPGPAMLPLPVLDEIAANIHVWGNLGVSPMEISHRTEAYKELSNETHQLLKQVLGISDDYEVISMHGGARTQFAAVPINIASKTATGYYIVSGLWSELALNEAKNFVNAQILRKLQPNFGWQYHDLSAPACYLHYTPNETVHGIYIQAPETDLPLVADATSALLGTKLDINKHDLIYAAAQKNIGIAGLTFVIIKKSLLADNKPMAKTPSIMHYHNQVASESMYNTPTTFAMYVANLMIKWLISQGGIDKISERNKARSNKLYSYLERSEFYNKLVPKEFRSPLNVTFDLKDNSLLPDFLAGANAAGLFALKGHKAVGGIRASLYNGMPNSGVDKLLEFLDHFANKA